MSLPVKLTWRGLAPVRLEAAGLQLNGGPPRLDVLVGLWDAMVTALALEEIDLREVVGLTGHRSRVAQARAALQVKLGRPAWALRGKRE